MPSAPFIRLDALSKSFAGVQALRGVGFTVGTGEVVCLAGENGSGKSTLIKILAGAEKADAGTIGIDGEMFAALDPRTSVAHGIQVIFQDFSLFPNLSVAENIAFSAELSAKRRLVARRRMRRIASEVLHRIAVEIDLDRRVETLSVADKQLVAIARALALDARLVIMDEPTTALTEREVRSLLAIIRRLKASGVAVLFVSHKLAEIFEVCEKIVVIRNGAVVADAPATEFDLGSLAFHMTGRHFPETFPAPAERGGRILEVEGLAREGSLHDIDLTLHRGEILGIAGLLGSGRTALAKALFGLVAVDRGRIRVEGREVRLRSPSEAVAAGIGYVPEDRLTEGLFLSQSIERNVAVGRLDAFANSIGVLDRPALGAEAAGWLGRLAVAAASDLAAPVKSLSGGNQQRVVLARWLAGKPRILVLNGPTVGVDIGSKADIHAIIASLSAEGLGIVVISDDLPELVACCHRILIMKAGRIVEEIGSGQVGERELAAKLAS